MYCLSNYDCESLTGTTVCKESVHGGAKTCQASPTCTQNCPSDKFCDAANMCQDGKLIILKFKIKIIRIISVICSVTSDCSTVTGLTSCKELITGGPLTCQSTSTCLAVPSCSHGEYCSSLNVCYGTGKVYRNKICSISLFHSSLLYIKY